MGKKNCCGKYRARVRIGTDCTGKPINKYVCAPTMRELEEKKTAVRRHYIEGEPITQDMMFYEYARKWYMIRKAPFITESTRKAWLHVVEK